MRIILTDTSNHFMIQPFPASKANRKDYISNTPVHKHTNPYRHRTHMIGSCKENNKAYSAKPHRKYRDCHREFYISCRTKAIGRNKCHNPHNRFHNTDPCYHVNTQLRAFWLHSSKICDRTYQKIENKTGYH